MYVFQVWYTRLEIQAYDLGLASCDTMSILYPATRTASDIDDRFTMMVKYLKFLINLLQLKSTSRHIVKLLSFMKIVILRVKCRFSRHDSQKN